MALKSVIHKAALEVADLDRGHYANYALTLAQHPSETLERMMLRLIVFALNASQDLQFTKGISTDDEPDLWLKNLSGEIELWIDLGQPDEKRIRKACGRARQVRIYTYHSRSAEIWWAQMANKLKRFGNLQLFHLQATENNRLDTLAVRNMSLQCTVQEGLCWLTDGEQSLELRVEPRLS